jgi:hypothetical protein
VIITRKSHPGIFGAFLEIDYDHGAVNRFEPEAKQYDIPERWESRLGQVEAFLSALTKDELNRFCTECPEERNVPGGDEGVAETADALLNDYFNGWIID